MKLQNVGKMLLVALGLLLSTLTSCRNSNPPPKDICIGDGFGGADCILKDGSRAYRSPSQLQNYWMTPQDDMRAFAGWCYDISPDQMARHMGSIQQSVTGAKK